MISPAFSVVSTSGVLPGRRWNSAIGMTRTSPSALTVSTSASSTQRDRHIGWVCGNALVAGTEHGMHSVEAAERRAARARVALVARLGDVIEVGAACPLQQIAPGGGSVAQLCARPRQQGPAQDPIPLAHALVSRKIAVSHRRAYAQAALRGVLDLVQRKTVDVDELRRSLNLQLHQVEQVRSACDELGAGPDRGGGGSNSRVGAIVGKSLHAGPPAACLIAATMLG